MEERYGEVLTTTEAMEYLKVSRKTLLKLVHEGQIPARKVGKDYRYLKSKLREFLQGHSEENYFKEKG